MVFCSIYIDFLCIIHNKRKEKQLLQQISMTLRLLQFHLFSSSKDSVEKKMTEDRGQRIMEICCNSCVSFLLSQNKYYRIPVHSLRCYWWRYPSLKERYKKVYFFRLVQRPPSKLIWWQYLCYWIVLQLKAFRTYLTWF